MQGVAIRNLLNFGGVIGHWRQGSGKQVKCPRTVRRQKSVLGTVRPRGNSPFAGAGKGYRRGAIYQKLDSYLSGYQAERDNQAREREKEGVFDCSR